MDSLLDSLYGTLKRLEGRVIPLGWTPAVVLSLVLTALAALILLAVVWV
jgi:hypothetical protein